MIDTMFREGTGALHHFDCRIKLILLPVMVVSFFLPLNLPYQGLWAAGFLLLSFVFLGISDSMTPLKAIYPLLILVTILTPLFYREGETIWAIGAFPFLTDQNLEETLRYLCRFTGISYLFFLFFRTTAMEDILLGLAWFRLPFFLTLILSTSLRYIPHLAGLYSQIKAAHSLRRNKDAGKNSRRGLNDIYPLLVSLVIQSVKTIPVLTMALELKGIGRENPRSRARQLAFPRKIGLQIFSALSSLVLLTILLIESL